MANKLQEVLSVLYDRADKLFPEYRFTYRPGTGWISDAKIDLYGNQTRKKGLVYIYEDSARKGFYSLYCHKNSEGISFWDALKNRHRWQQKEVFAELCKLADLESYANASLRLQLTRKSHPITQPTKQRRLSQEVLDTVHRLMINALYRHPKAAPTLDYLRGRGLTDQDIRFMRLGFFPGKAWLRKALGDRINKPEFSFFLNDALLGRSLGQSHTLAIPVNTTVRRQGSYCHLLAGFSFRATRPVHEEIPKYLNHRYCAKSDALMYFPPGAKRLVLVEGVLDSLLLKARGLPEAVGISGSTVSVQTLQNWVGQGVSELVLSLDSDEAGRKGAQRILNRIEARKLPLQVKLMHLPPGKDPDDLVVVSREGLGDYKPLLEQAKPIFLAGASLTQLKKTLRRTNPSLTNCVDLFLDAVHGIAFALPCERLTSRVVNPQIEAYRYQARVSLRLFMEALLSNPKMVPVVLNYLSLVRDSCQEATKPDLEAVFLDMNTLYQGLAASVVKTSQA